MHCSRTDSLAEGVCDGTKPCEMKKRSLLFPTKVGGQLYICVKVAERRKAVMGSMSLHAAWHFNSAKPLALAHLKGILVHLLRPSNLSWEAANGLPSTVSPST